MKKSECVYMCRERWYYHNKLNSDEVSLVYKAPISKPLVLNGVLRYNDKEKENIVQNAI